MSVKIRDLAKACGLSVSTVSKALNGYSDVSAETREAVQKAAEELGYHPSAIARGLKTGRSMNLGVIYQDAAGRGLTHSYFSPVLQAFREEAERRGYDITFISERPGVSLLEQCRVRSVDGVCVVCAPLEDPGIRGLVSGATFPLVSIDGACPGKPGIASDNEQGMTLLVRHALSLGHRRIAYVCGDPVRVTEMRVHIFREEMRRASVPLPRAYLCPAVYHDPRATNEAVRSLLALPEAPTCILLPDDYAALGGLDAIREMGLRIPGDVSVAGFDGVPLLQMCRPRLTSVRQDTSAIGKQAAALLIRLIEEPGAATPETERIPCELLPGDTLAAPRTL